MILVGYLPSSRPLLDEVIVKNACVIFSKAFKAPATICCPKPHPFWPITTVIPARFSRGCYCRGNSHCQCNAVVLGASASSLPMLSRHAVFRFGQRYSVADIAKFLKSTKYSCTVGCHFSAFTNIKANAASKGVLQVKEEEEIDDDGGWAPELMVEEVLIGDRELKIVQPEDVDEVIDMYIKQNRLDRDPYWARLWPSAIAMSEEILANPALVFGRRVCDLGAGLGLPALAALLAGAREVVLYDREPLALQCALLSMHANIPRLTSNLPLFLPLKPHDPVVATQDGHSLSNVSRDSTGISSSSSIFLQDIKPRCLASVGDILPELMASIEEANFQVSSVANQWPSGGEDFLPRQIAMSEMVDWGDKSIQNKDFDVVLACDVLYESASVDLIADLVPRLLTNRREAKLIVTDPLERCPQNRKSFIDLMQSAGSKRMVMECMERRQPLFENGIHQIELMHFKRDAT